MDKLRSQILSARKPVAPQSHSEAPPACSEAESIAPESNSPFGIFDIKKKRKKGRTTPIPSKESHQWADGRLRLIAGRQERVVLAIRDAARQAEKRGLNPTRDEIFVASSIRDGWNLKADQLSKGLKKLNAEGHISFTKVQQGRHARFLLRPRVSERPPPVEPPISLPPITPPPQPQQPHVIDHQPIPTQN